MRQPTLLRLLRYATTSTVNVTLLCAVVAVALWVGQFPLFVAAGALYTALVGRNVLSPRFAQRVLRSEAERAQQLPECTDIGDSSLRGTLSAIRAGYSEIARVLRQTPDPIKRQVRGGLASLEELRAHAARLLREGDELGRYLRLVSRTPIEHELRRLQGMLDRARDDVRDEYEKALSVRREQLAAIDHIERQQARVLASLERILGTVEAFPSWIYRLQVLERRVREDAVGDADEELRHIDGDILATRHLLEELADVASEARAPGLTAVPPALCELTDESLADGNDARGAGVGLPRLGAGV